MRATVSGATRGLTAFHKRWPAAAAFAFFAAVFLLPGTASSCDSSDYNYQTLFQTERVACGGENYNPISDSAVKFVNLSFTSVGEGFKAAGGSGEIKLLIKRPVRFEPSVEFGEELSRKIADSIETEIRTSFGSYKARVCDSSETEGIYKALGFSVDSGEMAIFTPEVLKKLHSEKNIFAVIDISFHSMTFAKYFQFNIKTPAADRRDLARTDKYEARIRYKITRCETGDILWIDEVAGLSDDSFYYSLFEKGLMYNLKQVCINESALQ